MGLSTTRGLYGIHSVTFYNQTSRVPYGMLRVLQGSQFSLAGDTIALQGGSNRFPWQIEDGFITAEMALTFNEYPDFLYTVLLGKTPTANAAEATGNVGTLANVNGTSVLDATTGIASVTLKAASSSELKMGKYVISAIDATTVNVYCMSNVDFARGTAETFEDDTLKINAAPITIVDTGATVDIDNFGLTLTSGSGTVAMTAGDTAAFEIRPENSGSSIVTVGGTTDTFPTFGAVIYAQQESSGRMFEIDVYAMKAIGLPHNFDAKAFSEASVTAQAYYSADRNGVFDMRVVTPV